MNLKQYGEIGSRSAEKESLRDILRAANKPSSIDSKKSATMTKKQLKPLSENQSRKVTKVSSLSKEVQRSASTPAISLENISKSSYLLSTEESWDRGSNLRECLRFNKEATKSAVVALIIDVISFVDAKKSLEREEDIFFTADAIIEEFPTLKIEELKLVCKRLKLGYYGKYYERLKAAEFIEAIQQHEGERAEYLEQKHRTEAAQIEVETAALNKEVYSFRAVADRLKLPRKGARTMRDFMKEGALLTAEELTAIEQVKNEAHKKQTP